MQPPELSRNEHDLKKGIRFFHRNALAAKLSKQILAEDGTAASSGVFLAAPRRTGKSTFLREDLRPQLEADGAYVIYVDLWADREADPGEMIVAAVRSALAEFDNVAVRLARKSGLTNVGGKGLSFSLDRVGLGANVSLSEALAELSDELQKPIALIIDEAQHAIATEKGYDALYALKAARDELNSSSHHGLRVVATGSNRDKLAMLRNSRDQAFFGAPLIAFPSLDHHYVRWFCDGARLPAKLDPEAVWPLFQRASFRPEVLGSAVDELRYDFSLEPEQVPSRFLAAVENQIEDQDNQTLRVVHSLTPLQSAVLRVLAARRETYSPFESETINAYISVLRDIAPNEKIIPDTSNVQQALLALQEKLLVWKEKRGVYALEETTLADLMDSHGMLAAVPSVPSK
jgi:hypothetical protein